MSDHSFDLSDPAIGALIRRKAAKLARLAPDPAVSRGDYAQDLSMAILARAGKFDPSRGEAGAFLHVVLESAVANVLRNFHAAKRTPPGERESSVDREDSRLTDSDQTRDLVLDVQDALVRLPKPLREFADRVANSDTLAEAARDLGISRGTLYARLGSIRKRFESSELQKSVRNRPDSSSSNRVVP